MRWVTTIKERDEIELNIECGWCWCSRIMTSWNTEVHMRTRVNNLDEVFKDFNLFFLFISIQHIVDSSERWTEWAARMTERFFLPFFCFIALKTRKFDAMEAKEIRKFLISHGKTSTIQKTSTHSYNIMNKFHDFLFLFHSFRFPSSTFPICYCVAQGFQGKRYIVVHFKKLYFIFIRSGNKMYI